MESYGGSGIRRTSERIAALADQIQATDMDHFLLDERDQVGTDLPFVVSDDGFENAHSGREP